MAGGWVKLEKTNLWYRSNLVELLDEKDIKKSSFYDERDDDKIDIEAMKEKASALEDMQMDFQSLLVRWRLNPTFFNFLRIILFFQLILDQYLLLSATHFLKHHSNHFRIFLQDFWLFFFQVF